MAPKHSARKEPQQQDQDPLFFYMPKEKYGEFCQWHSSSFSVSKRQIAILVGRPVDEDNHQEAEAEANPDGDLTIITFNCAEQFMMYCKAARFGDRDRQARVLATDSPKEQKRLGKLTVGFTDSSWDEVKSDVVTDGNMAKFGQNPHLGRKLLATGDRMLCEAASRDRVWGIGYTAKHAMTQRKHWGENRLGKALMVVRQRIRDRDGEEAWTLGLEEGDPRTFEEN